VWGEVAALHQAVDIALSLKRLYLVLGELAPLRPDLLDDAAGGVRCCLAPEGSTHNLHW
jgi:hypothetical protein